MENPHSFAGTFTLEIPIFKKTYDFFKEVYVFELDFPKKDRYTLGQRCENHLLEVLEGIMIAAQSPRDEKLEILKRVSNKLDLLKVFVRLALDVKSLNDKRYIICLNYLEEIGRMLGGWMKSIRAEQPRQ
jgi:hypothetical protein